MSDRVVKFRDALGATESYLHAVRMMLQTMKIEGSRDACALDLILEGASTEVAKAQELVDEMEGE